MSDRILVWAPLLVVIALWVLGLILAYRYTRRYFLESLTKIKGED